MSGLSLGLLISALYVKSLKVIFLALQQEKWNELNIERELKSEDKPPSKTEEVHKYREYISAYPSQKPLELVTGRNTYQVIGVTF